jgi:signal transduction histidine kinase
MRFRAALIACAGLMVSISGSQPASAAIRQVVLLFGERVELPAMSAMEADITRTLRSSAAEPVEVHIENLDLSQSRSPSYKTALRDFLHEKYLNRKIDVAVAVMQPALDFLLNFGDVIFPGTSIAFTGLDRRDIANRSLPLNVDGVFAKREFTPTIDLALRLHPDTQKIVVISGTSNFDVSLLAEAKKEFGDFEKRVSFTYLSNLSLNDQLFQLSHLSKQTIVLFTTFFRDGTGAPFVPHEVVEQVSAAANRPVYGFADQFLGRGIVGGSLYSFSALGTETGKLISRILVGREHTQLLFDVPRMLMFDWRQMQRWGISEGGLPPDSAIYFREPGAWEKYGWQIALVCTLVVFQAALISGLLFERRRRQLAEVQLRQRMTELAHSNRYSLAGELAATIAHEINQPLGAILTNCETLEAMLQSPMPDLSELREIAADIRRDDQRASDVILHLRSLLKKSPPQLKDIDLNEPVRDTIHFLSTLAVARNIDLNSSIAPMPLPVKGILVQLQQVILILVVNAMDAMSDLPGGQRKLAIATGRAGNFAQASVSDTGPGVPPDKLKEIFVPFFSTKAQGMGMGLSIARTIIEVHGGQIWAENKTGGGAVFRILLPLAKTHGGARGDRPDGWESCPSD